MTSSLSFADITSENDRFTLLCQADKITGFQWRNVEWQFTKYKPVMTIIKKQDDEKSEDADEKHLQAMSEMSELMKDSNKMQSWFESKEQEFNSLPED